MIAVSIVQAMKKAPTRVRKPKPTRTPPTSSERAASPNQSHGGRIKVKGVVPEVQKLKPGPLEAPNTFCEPCAIIVAAIGHRMGIVIHEEEVAIGFRNSYGYSLIDALSERA